MKNNTLHAYICPREARNAADLSSVAPRAAQKALRFHASFPEYAETPLTVLPALAKALGVQCIFVKDESKRFGLNAFKALGGSYAMSCVLATALGVGGEPDELGLPGLTAPRALQVLGTQTFVTATDGNHGRGVAWAAKKLGHRAVVYLPRGSAAERLENIRAEGAQAFITELSYDDAVRKARRDAEENGWILLQDTAWDGYEEVPTHIMQGYLTLALEIVTQLQRTGEAPPTHLFLQAGVGSFAGAILGFFAALYGEKCPVSVIIEPERAACLYETATAGDGALHAASGDLCTMMAGLACGEPCTVSWKILSAYADAFITCPDSISADGMRLLGRPRGGDAAIISGESGAVGAGLLAALMTDPDQDALRSALGLKADSRVLLISTEGDTDRKNYRDVLKTEPLK